MTIYKKEQAEIKNNNLIEITPKGEGYVEGYLDAQEKRTQSKHVKDRKSGGLRTYRNCEKCNIKTKGIWKYKCKYYCYKCYKEFAHILGIK